MEHVETSTFPPGTAETVVAQVKNIRDGSDHVSSCTYEGSEAAGWRMTTVWIVPD